MSSSEVSIPNGRPRLFSQLRRVRDISSRAKFQSPTGVPGYLASAPCRAWSAVWWFQSPTGVPGYLAKVPMPRLEKKLIQFQSPTGVPGYLAFVKTALRIGDISGFNPQRASQAI